MEAVDLNFDGARVEACVEAQVPGVGVGKVIWLS